MNPDPETSPSSKVIGSVFDNKYRVTEFLAKGGMGTVYKGVQLPPNERPIAIKTLAVGKDDPLFRRRFFNEAAMCASIKHKQVVSVFDYGATEDGICYIVMELLEGQSLEELLEKKTKLPPKVALGALYDLCEALEQAHRLGFIHRDLKPANIHITSATNTKLQIKVLDFGLAKRLATPDGLTMAGTFLGSPRYMSPEQINGGTISIQTDVYNLGLILYRMITGVPTFEGEIVSALLVAQATSPPRPFREVLQSTAHLEQVQWITTTCLHKSPSQRFASVTELKRAVRIAMDELPLTKKSTLSLNNNGMVRKASPDTPSSQTKPNDIVITTLAFTSLTIAVFASGMVVARIFWVP